MGKEDKTFLNLAIEYLESKDGPQPITDILNYVMDAKTVKKSELDDTKAQFIMDFMLSGNFIYCGGNDEWDLKSRQPLSVIDKDAVEFSATEKEFNKEAEKNEMGSFSERVEAVTDEEGNFSVEVINDASEEENEEDEGKESDDLSEEFGDQ